MALEEKTKQITLLRLRADGVAYFDLNGTEFTYCPRGALFDKSSNFQPVKTELLEAPPNRLAEQRSFSSLIDAFQYAEVLTDIALAAQWAYILQAFPDVPGHKGVEKDIHDALNHARLFLPSLRGSAHERTINDVAHMDIPQLTAWANEHEELLPYQTKITPPQAKRYAQRR